MTENKDAVNLWTVGTLALWLAIFLVGLFPGIAFVWLREVGYVVTVRAVINSVWFISLSCAAFLGWFTFSRCMECGDEIDVALGKSVQIIILAVTAFLPMNLEKVFLYAHIPLPFYRYLILSVLATKSLAWLYLVIMILRYYLVSGHVVYKNIPLIFPSAFLPPEENDATATIDTENVEQ